MWQLCSLENGKLRKRRRKRNRALKEAMRWWKFFFFWQHLNFISGKTYAKKLRFVSSSVVQKKNCFRYSRFSFCAILCFFDFLFLFPISFIFGRRYCDIRVMNWWRVCDYVKLCQPKRKFILPKLMFLYIFIGNERILRIIYSKEKCVSFSLFAFVQIKRIKLLQRVDSIHFGCRDRLKWPSR